MKIVATCRIAKGSEIFIDNGKDYWQTSFVIHRGVVSSVLAAEKVTVRKKRVGPGGKRGLDKGAAKNVGKGKPTGPRLKKEEATVEAVKATAVESSDIYGSGESDDDDDDDSSSSSLDNGDGGDGSDVELENVVAAAEVAPRSKKKGGKARWPEV